MSEATLIVTAPDYEDATASRQLEGMEVASVGVPLGDFEIEIRGETGEPVENGVIGEIHVRGGSVTPGYLSDVDRTVGSGNTGWLVTGDLGLQDRQGRLFVTGRTKDVIIHQGKNFYGHDIAARVEELPFVRRGKVFVLEVAVDRRDRIVIMTAPPKGTAPDTVDGLEEFKSSIRKCVLTEFGLPVHDVFVLRQLPKTTSGKVARHRCAQIYLDSRQDLRPEGL
jgi:acyl-CoA synthetase (AMP-forming)/AMP-acid ligase II